MYSFESSNSRTLLHALVIATFVVAAVLFGFSGVEGIPYPLIFQSGAILCLVAAVYLTARYSVKLYRYAVEPNGILDAGGVEQYDLVITEITGQKIKVVARVALRDIGEVAVVSRKDKETRATIREKLCPDKHVFCYANTPVLPEECYISVPDEEAVLIIPVDKQMTAILQKRL